MNGSGDQRKATPPHEPLPPHLASTISTIIGHAAQAI